MRASNRKIRVWAGIGGSAVITAVSLAVLSPSAASTQKRPQHRVTPAQAMRMIRAAFPVFDRPQRPGDTVRLPGQRGAPSAGGASQSRLVYSGKHGSAYLSIQGTDLCFSYVFAGPPAGESGGCGPATLTSEIGLGTIFSTGSGGYSTWGANPPGVAALGTTTMVADALPSGVHSVTVDMANGTQKTIPTVNGVVVFNGTSARDFQFVDPGGVKQIQRIS
jgi:hypothetical protein